MARHPEVKEKEIIEAALALQKKGKVPNPGAIRAQLGYRGSLVRIKSVWQNFIQQRDQKLMPEAETELCFEALPENYADNAKELIKRLNIALEQVVVEAYQYSSKVFEKRAQDIESRGEAKLHQYVEAEHEADKSISRLEVEIDDLQKELSEIADQNAKLLIENAELRGRLAVFDERYAVSEEGRERGEVV